MNKKHTTDMGFRCFFLTTLLSFGFLGLRVGAQQFQPLWLIEWADSNMMMVITDTRGGNIGVQKYVPFDSLLIARVNALGLGGSCNDTITQTGHGFSVGDMLGQPAGGGNYFAANTADPDNLPVAAVLTVVDADRFVPCNEGFFYWVHGRDVGFDYFLQDGGGVDTLPDSEYNVFAFRTFSAGIAYFDIPELIVRDTADGGGGGGGGQTQVAASNGLNNQGTATNADIELGGTLDKDTDINYEARKLTFTRTGNGIQFQINGASAADGIRISPNPAIDQNKEAGSFMQKNTAAGNPASIKWSEYDMPLSVAPIIAAPTFYIYDPFSGSYWYSNAVGENSGVQIDNEGGNEWKVRLGGDLTEDANISFNEGVYHFRIWDGLSVIDPDSMINFKIQFDDDSQPFFDFEFDKAIGGIMHRMDIRVDSTQIYMRMQKGANSTVFRIDPFSIVVNSLPVYANDAAADADTDLPAGGLYLVTGNRTVFIKP